MATKGKIINIPIEEVFKIVRKKYKLSKRAEGFVNFQTIGSAKKLKGIGFSIIDKDS